MENIESSDIGQLRKYSDVIHKIGDRSTMDHYLRLLTQTLINLNINSINPLVLASLCNNVCAKILIESLSTPITQQACDFITFMRDSNLLPPVYRRHFD